MEAIMEATKLKDTDAMKIETLLDNEVIMAVENIRKLRYINIGSVQSRANFSDLTWLLR